MRRPRPSFRALRVAALAMWALPAIGLLGAARADTVASLLGNFTINQFCGLRLEGDSLELHYVVVYGQLPALRELHRADANGDGVTSQGERDAYAGELAGRLAEGLSLSVDGAPVALRLTRAATELPREQGGFSLRLDLDYSASLPSPAAATHRLEFVDHNFDGNVGWREIAVEAAPGLSAFDTDAHGSSLTGALREALKSLPESGPLDERAVHVSYARGAPPPGAVPLTARSVPGSARTAEQGAPAAVPGADRTWIERRTRSLVDAISAPRLDLGIAASVLLGALLLGAVHALSPGHGKTLVGAYLIGSRGTPRHALILGSTVTVTHTLGVFLLGFATLYASRFVVPERLFPVLNLMSASMVVVLGVVLLARRVSVARRQLASPACALQFEPVAAASVPSLVHPQRVLAVSAADPTLHSHGGGPLHSHLPPGADGAPVTLRSLVTLGVSGGLLPCPSALVLLLSAVALNKAAYGMLLVLAFSIGLAITLTLIGLMFLSARNRFLDVARFRSARWSHLLPVMSAAFITVVGAALTYAALRNFG